MPDNGLMPAAELEYLFRHTAIREAVYSAASPAERARLHDLASAAWGELVAGGANGVCAREQARHGAEAARARAQADRQRKEDILDAAELRFARAGAEDADRAYQVQDAARLWRVVADHRLTTPPERRLALRHAAEAMRHAGRLEDSRRCLEQVRELGPDAEESARVCISMSSVLRALGRHAEAEAEILRALASDLPAVLRAEALSMLGTLHRERGRNKDAQAELEEALMVARGANDALSEAKCAAALATLFAQTGQPDAAEPLYRRAMQIHRDGGDPRGQAIYAGNLAITLRDLGRNEEAEVLCRQALDRHRELGNRSDEALCQGNLAIILKATGRTHEAELCYRRALHIFREQGNAPLEGQYLTNLGNLLDDTGRTVQAVDAYEHALQILRAGGLKRPLGYALGNLAVARQKLGLVEEALGAYSEAISVLADVGTLPAAAAFMCLRGELLLLTGDVASAQRDLEAADTVLRPVALRSYRMQYWVPLKVRLLAHGGHIEEAFALVREAQRKTGKVSHTSEQARTLEVIGGVLGAAGSGRLVNGHVPDQLSRELRKVLSARMPAFR
ncbi:MAG: tetratricopeptide repeat protein [Planctomycetes bacterium]|nr:tetratricopeptide repeat protein [Planctomycetota bacterium]